MTQSAFSIIVDFIKLISDAKIPKNFNDCGNTFLELVGDEKINFSKKWFCKTCNEAVIIINNKQRMCNNCSNR